MRFMVQVRATAESEAGVMPSHELMAAMIAFNEELDRAGVMRAGEGLQPTAKGARLSWSDGQLAVTEGPFGSPRELIAGFWLVEMNSRQDVIDAFSRCPPPAGGGSGELEIRQIFEAADFPPEILSPELAARAGRK